MHEVASRLRSEREQIAADAVGRAFDQRPQLWQRYGLQGRATCIQDTAYHVDFLAEAVEFGQAGMFSAYVQWAADVLRHRDVPFRHLADTLQCLADSLRSRWSDARGALAASYVQAALDAAQHPPPGQPVKMEAAARHYLQALLQGDKRGAMQAVLAAVEQGTSVESVYLRILQPALHEVGRLWQANRISVGQEHFCAASTGLAMSLLYPRIAGNRLPSRSAVLCCVQGEQHELGLRMVSDLLEIAGWGVYCAGASMPDRDVVRTVAEQRADLLAISCTYVPHLHRVAALIRNARSAPGGASLKVIVGGLAFLRTPELWREVGADGFAADAGSAPAVASRLVGVANSSVERVAGAHHAGADVRDRRRLG